MGTVIWIVQGLLAVAFLMAGAMKMMQPKEKLAENMAWVEDFDSPMLKIIGAVEVAGALGLLVPAFTGLADSLVVAAALGLAVIMMMAAYTHIKRDEQKEMIVNLVLFMMALVVVYARTGPYPL